MRLLKEATRQTFHHMGYHITRTRPQNRFSAMSETLTMMREVGYAPKIVIDGGANMGQWTRMVRSIFSKAEIHMIEPQPACAKTLNNLVSRDPNLKFHAVALTESGISNVRMIGIGENGGYSGGYVAKHSETSDGTGEIECNATTLDALFAGCVKLSDRVLLKLDLENHEIPALQGASLLLESIEVILTELQFFEINDNGRPVFSDFIEFLQKRGFALYDFACLSPRPRDMRLRQGDVIFVRQESELLADRSWE